jgi:glucose-6-phosphate isomerase
MTLQVLAPDNCGTALGPLVDQLYQQRFASRLFDRDASLWGPEAEAEARIRLGWVDAPARSQEIVAAALALRKELSSQGISRIVLCGMGGSSLGPEVIAQAHGISLTVLDTTHPAELRRILDDDLRNTAVIVSSKSGSTIETLTQADAFQQAFEQRGLPAKQHLIFITDPGSPLGEKRSEGYRVFLADPEVGGRYSAFTAFGLVPAILAGLDPQRLIDDATASREMLRRDDKENPALVLAAALAASLPTRYVLLLREPRSGGFGLGDWIEQLLAESTGKMGNGVLPMALGSTAPEFDRLPSNAQIIDLGSQESNSSHLSVSGTLGEQLMLWEVATVALGALLRLNPFDQPDVETAKQAAREALSQPAVAGADVSLLVAEDEAALDELVTDLSSALPADGYVAIQAFLDRGSQAAEFAVSLRETLAERLGVPVSLGWGPRYLHSVGQFHKGGRPSGVFLQLIDEPGAEQQEGQHFRRFEMLLRAQCAGDREVLSARGRPVITRAVSAAANTKGLR